MSYLDQLFKFLTSSYGLIGVVLCLLILVQANEAHRRQHWFLLALCGFAASLGEFKNEWILEAPALAFPLQQLRTMGRPLTIFLLGLLLSIAFKTPKGWRSILIPKPITYLIIVQIVIFLKTLQYGSISFAFIGIFTFGAVVLTIIYGPSRWLQDERNFELAIWSLAMVGILFVIANLYQATINVSPITVVQGLFHGTTGNPQAAAILLVLTIPCFLFLYQKHDQYPLIKQLLILFFGLVILGLISTGSRTGVLSAIFSVILYYRYYSGKLFWLLIILTVVIFGLLFVPYELDFFDIGIAFDKLSSQSNTRELVWKAQWRTFLTYPFFGIPLTSERLRYGENSWLAAGAALGLLGFIPLVIFGIKSIKMMKQLNKIAIRRPDYYPHCSVVIAGLGSLLLSSFAEAYLLGNLTFPLFALLLYEALGTYLLELDRIEQYVQQVKFKKNILSKYQRIENE
ncbi:MAG: O-antigen ligase family protein [Coleofasciculus sp. D1-CHI-01]|uniref:O-antigen ligase family protein n=1 Tax=Coleofasciculus sp. D1-CHI-01 TaxID=3068482 RepID=UPI0032FC5D8F